MNNNNKLWLLFKSKCSSQNVCGSSSDGECYCSTEKHSHYCFIISDLEFAFCLFVCLFVKNLQFSKNKIWDLQTFFFFHQLPQSPCVHLQVTNTWWVEVGGASQWAAGLIVNWLLREKTVKGQRQNQRNSLREQTAIASPGRLHLTSFSWSEEDKWTRTWTNTRWVSASLNFTFDRKTSEVEVKRKTCWFLCVCMSQYGLVLNEN